jgi:energy-coupling factor transport system substrate-specific component
MTDVAGSQPKRTGWLAGLTTQDILVIAVLGVGVGVLLAQYGIFATYVGTAFGPIAQAFTFGVFWMTGVLTGYIVQKPGAAFLGGVIGTIGQVLGGNPAGLIVLTYSVIQGGANELGFGLFRYKRWDIVSCMVAGFLCGPIVFVYDYLQYLTALPLDQNLLNLLARCISGALFAGLLPKLIGDAIAATGVLKDFPIGQKRLAERRMAQTS